MAAPLSVLVWRILWTVESVGRQSVGSQSQTWEKAAPSSILAWRIPWKAEPVGLQSVGLHRVRLD